MDRLEKALQKAREQRGVVRPASGAAGAVAVGSAEPVSGTAASPPSGPAQVGGAKSSAVEVRHADLERNRIVARRARDANADIFRILRTKVLQEMERIGAKTLAVTSPSYGEGKSTIAVNLAMSLALDVKQTVLLVDLDLRDPSVHQFLGINSNVGLTDYFLNDTPVPECLVKPEIERLMVLPIAKPLDNSSEILGTPKMATLANELKTRYADRIVIYDMPPVLTQDDTIAFLPHVDAVLLVVRDGFTVSDHIGRCSSLLSSDKFIGLILNDGS